MYFYYKYRGLVRKVEMGYKSKDTYDWGCCEGGELSILRRKVVDGSFLRNCEAFCLDRVYFFINIGEKSKWDRYI